MKSIQKERPSLCQKQVFRVKVMKTFWQAGVPLNKIEEFRDLFEETGFHFFNTRNLHDLMPLIVDEEMCQIKSDMKGKR